ncbi:hypothetical protein QLQ12_38360 [Actinoplanes sp. NEAU-A12]|uniref:Uncharacterized protein n=1 Tax=Actinoplanes sandaracinus TaxID=3045177 RepID=A0ABT6WXK8_9ACTN|nr:hypothetical protein [Actinoplanes sandaracinus]MDI6104469.1 hypothetical protein [Actinoplanes sandaracinus]
MSAGAKIGQMVSLVRVGQVRRLKTSVSEIVNVIIASLAEQANPLALGATIEAVSTSRSRRLNAIT